MGENTNYASPAMGSELITVIQEWGSEIITARSMNTSTQYTQKANQVIELIGQERADT